MTTHAKYSPSSAYIWLRCGLYIRFASMFPRTTSAAAEEGTRLHDLAAKAIEQGQASVPGEDCLSVYLEEVYKAAEDGELFVEEKLEIFGDECTGTADAVPVGKNIIKVIDLKTGKTPVKAFENPQLILYALGAIKRHAMPDSADAELVIIQPNKASGWPVDVWRTSVGDLKAYAPKFLRAIERSKQTPPIAMAGRHCYFCPAKMYCNEHKIQTGLLKRRKRQ